MGNPDPKGPPMKTSTPGRLAAAGLVAMTVAMTLSTTAHAAGRAQAGVSMGIYSTWDLAPTSSVTGTGWRDGVVVETVDRVGDPPGATIQVYDGVARTRIEMQAQGLLLQADGAPPLPVSGMRALASDLEAGTLALKSQSGYVASPPPREHRVAFGVGYSFAELIQSFEVRWAKDHVGPIEIQLGLLVNGEVLVNDGRDGRIAGLGVYLELGNVATGLPPLVFPSPDPLVRYEAGVNDARLSIGGGFINSQCHAAADYCESWINLYAAFDMRGRKLSDGSTDFAFGAAHDFDFTGQLTLTSSPGLTVLRVDNLGNVLPQYAWVNPAPVPEPGAAVLMGVGLLGVWMTRGRRSIPGG
jgi:hypothetical protein